VAGATLKVRHALAQAYCRSKEVVACAGLAETALPKRQAGKARARACANLRGRTRECARGQKRRARTENLPAQAGQTVGTAPRGWLAPAGAGLAGLAELAQSGARGQGLNKPQSAAQGRGVRCRSGKAKPKMLSGFLRPNA